ncbi:hypothetical protein MVEN_02418300 [Mycena venus]|uniref:BTB domain-containing protein n=1 Tax=Mycena venus TaxID=2733690 RepID=A0A8H7CBF9_9AGAR|nr:hypothetical protein MVEN_02418300 [Mycena venus]
MSRPQFYDPNSPEEQPVPLPSAPQLTLAEGIVLQPPLTRRGTGPGLIAFVPPDSTLNLSFKSGDNKPLDPEPVQKWAEEGFAVVGITGHGSVSDNLKTAVDGLLNLKELDTRDKFAVAVYDPNVLAEVVAAIPQDPRLICLVVYGYSLVTPLLYPRWFACPHLQTSPLFRTLLCANWIVLLRRSFFLKRPTSTLPRLPSRIAKPPCTSRNTSVDHAIWEEHTYFEFEVRSVAKTMGTMVAEPYVNHVPTLAGGIGRKQLSAFYRDHFVFNNPKDTWMQTISRTVGSDRVVDEFIFHATHDKQIDWLLPGVPPTGKKFAIPMLGVINIRGDRLYHEHIWWDQGTAFCHLIRSSTMASPPAKRKRTEDASITRSDIWYKDGSVVLQAQQHQFRVHFSILGQHSSFFRDLEDLPQPPDQPTLDGCPIVELHDDAEDVENLLRALYNASFLFQETLPFPAVAALIRLGRKYLFRDLMKSAMERLTVHYPSAIEAYDAPLPPGRRIIQYPGIHFDVVSLARENNILLSVLPAAYWRAVKQCDSPTNLIDGIAANVSSRSNSNKVIHWDGFGNGNMITSAPILGSALATGRPYCADTWITSSYEFFSTYASSEKICAQCQQHTIESAAAGRKRIWEDLPGFFELPPWDELTGDL